jgi:hypothetical protein
MNRKTLLPILLIPLFFTEGVAQGIVANNGAQLLINSGTQVIVTGSYNQSGATTALTNQGTLSLSTHLQNSSDATVQGNGTYIVSGNWDNAASFVAGTSTVEMTGNDLVATINSGNNSFYSLTLNKGASTSELDLVTNSATVSNLLTLQGTNKLKLGTFNLTVANPIVSYDNTRFVVTQSTGKLIATTIGVAGFVFPIGVSTTSYTPLSIKQTGAALSLGVLVQGNVLSNGTSGSPLTSGVVNKSWVVTEESTPLSKDLTLTPQWNASDEASLDVTKCGVSRWNVMNSAWDLAWANVGARSGTDPYTRTRSGIAEVGTFVVGSKPVATYVQLSAKVFLQGAYAGSSLMNDGLRSANLIPNSEDKVTAAGQSPRPNGYAHTAWGGSEAGASGIFGVQTPTDNNIVDWVFVELRDKTTSSTILHSRAALLRRNGDIVNEDGSSPLKIYGVPNGDYHISIKHRNHLAVRTANSKILSTTSPTAIDFTTSLSEALTGTPAAMATMSDGKFALWGGNVNSDATVRRNGPAGVNDYSLLTTYLGASTTLSNVYRREDVNMNGTVTRTGPVSINDASRLANFLGTNTIVTAHFLNL